MTNQIRLYEELSMNSHVALHSHFYDGWVILTSNGYTGRANSVNVLYPSTIPLECTPRICKWYKTTKSQSICTRSLDSRKYILIGIE